MSDLFPFDIESDDRADDDGPAGYRAVQAADVRDLPAPGGHDELFGHDDGPGSYAEDTSTEYPVRIAAPIATRPAAGRVISAGNVTLTSTDTRPILIGLDASLIQAQSVAYLVVIVTGSGALAGAQDALPGQRCVIADGTLTLPHIAGMWLYPPASDDVAVSWVVVGGVA